MPAKIPVLSQVGTVKVGICTLAFLAVSCAVLTVWYEHPEQALGRSWWIRIPLVVLALNLASITITRFRRSWTQAGMISTHAGLITILIGALLTSTTGKNGQISFSEGETARSSVEFADVLAVRENPQALPLEMPLHFGAAPSRENVDVTMAVPGGTTVTVDRYYHRFRSHDELQNDAKEPNPALWVMWMERDGAQDSVYLFDKDQGRPRMAQIAGLPALFTYTTADSEQQVQESTKSALLARQGEIFVWSKPDQADPQLVGVADSLGKDVAIEGTPYTLRLDRLMPNFKLTEAREEVSDGDVPLNPVVLATLAGPQGAEKKRLFTPGHEPPMGMGSKWPEGIRVQYHLVHTLRFFRLPDGKHSLVGSLLDDPSKPLALSTAEPVEVKWLGVLMQGHSFDRARIEQVVDNANDVDTPAVHVTARHAAHSASAWIPLAGYGGGWTSLALGDATLLIGFQQRPTATALPFQVRLDRFVEETYEGTASPMAWESHVTVTDTERGKTFQYPIKMNEPLLYRGWKFFQSDKRQDEHTGAWTSTLSVSWDPGQWPVYVGCFFVVAGVLFLFYAKPAVARWESLRLQASGAAPKSSSIVPSPPEPVKA